MRAVASLLVAVLASCLQPATTSCGALACPESTACVALATNGLTCLPVAGCDAAAAGAPCDPGNGQEGRCEGGGCRPIERCGNGIVDLGESCDCGDAQVTPRADCNSRNNSDTDPLSPCRGDCQLRTCGDAQLDATEQCEGDAIADGLTCETFGYYEGTLACSQLCVVDRSDCHRRCGDGVLDLDREYCDPQAAGPVGYCVDFSYSSGILRCGSSCGPRFGDCTDGNTFTDLLPASSDLVDVVRGPTASSAWVIARSNLWLYDDASGLRALGSPSSQDLVDVSSTGTRAVVSARDGNVYVYDATGVVTSTLVAPHVCDQVTMTAEDTFACIGAGGVAWWSAGSWEPTLAGPSALDAIARPDGSVIYTNFAGSPSFAVNAHRATRTEVTPMNGWSSSVERFHEVTDGSGTTPPGLYGGLAYGGATYGMVRLEGDTWWTAAGTEAYLQLENIGGRQFAGRRFRAGEVVILPDRTTGTIDSAATSCERFVGVGTRALCIASGLTLPGKRLLRYAGATVSQTVALGLGADTLSDAYVDDRERMYFVGKAGAGGTSPVSTWRPPAGPPLWDRIAGVAENDVLLLGRDGGFAPYSYLALWDGAAWTVASSPRRITAAVPLGNGEVLASIAGAVTGCDLVKGPVTHLTAVVDASPVCLTSLWASPSGHLWGAVGGRVRDISAHATIEHATTATTGWLAGRDDGHLWHVTSDQIWFHDGATWTRQVQVGVPTDFDWVSVGADAVIATSRQPAPMTWLLFEREAVPSWNKLRLPGDTTSMVQPRLRPWGVVFRALDETLRYSVWENDWPR